ncbi:MULTISPECIES: hypothetical protein [Burkholderia]|uniref:hypothetical protein n=1 Tax=Burkholderia TaxID=32008 RepID=UPI001E47CA75|nr:MULTISPECIES: hypothetical protein [Burkholderia]
MTTLIVWGTSAIGVSVFVPIAVRIPTSPIDAAFASPFTAISGNVTPGAASIRLAAPIACASFTACAACAQAWPDAAAQSTPPATIVIARRPASVPLPIVQCPVMVAAGSACPLVKVRAVRHPLRFFDDCRSRRQRVPAGCAVNERR